MSRPGTAPGDRRADDAPAPEATADVDVEADGTLDLTDAPPRALTPDEQARFEQSIWLAKSMSSKRLPRP